MTLRPLHAALATGLLFAAAVPASHAQTVRDVLGAILSPDSSDPSLFRCESVGGAVKTCTLPAGASAQFIRQTSQAACVQGRTMLLSATSITVSQGCRAEFRLVASNTYPGSTPGTVPGLTASLEQALVAQLRNNVRSTNESGAPMDVRVVSAQPYAVSSYETGYTGNAQATWGTRTVPLEYRFVHDTRSNLLNNLSYRFLPANVNEGGVNQGSSTVWGSGTSMGATTRAAVASAILAEVRRQNPGQKVQVVVNDLYRQSGIDSRNYRYIGKYGVSINDGDWMTRYYQARVYLTKNTVSELNVNVTP